VSLVLWVSKYCWNDW